MVKIKILLISCLATAIICIAGTFAGVYFYTQKDLAKLRDDYRQANIDRDAANKTIAGLQERIDEYDRIIQQSGGRIQAGLSDAERTNEEYIAGLQKLREDMRKFDPTK